MDRQTIAALTETVVVDSIAKIRLTVQRWLSSSTTFHIPGQSLTCACRLGDVAGASLGAFAIGALGTIAGTFVAWLLIGSQMGPDGYKVGNHAIASSHQHLTSAHMWRVAPHAERCNMGVTQVQYKQSGSNRQPIRYPPDDMICDDIM